MKYKDLDSLKADMLDIITNIIPDKEKYETTPISVIPMLLNNIAIVMRDIVLALKLPFEHCEENDILLFKVAAITALYKHPPRATIDTPLWDHIWNLPIPRPVEFTGRVQDVEIKLLDYLGVIIGVSYYSLYKLYISDNSMLPLDEHVQPYIRNALTAREKEEPISTEDLNVFASTVGGGRRMDMFVTEMPHPSHNYNPREFNDSVSLLIKLNEELLRLEAIKADAEQRLIGVRTNIDNLIKSL